MQVGEIAPPAAGDKNFFSGALGMFQHAHAPPAFPGLHRAQQSRAAGPQYEHIELLIHRVLQLYRDP